MKWRWAAYITLTNQTCWARRVLDSNIRGRDTPPRRSMADIGELAGWQLDASGKGQ